MTARSSAAVDSGSRRSLGARCPHRSVWFAVLVVLSFTVPRRAIAQQTVLSGRVLDAKTERPIEGAYIELPRFKRRVLSDSSGTFRLREIVAGVYDVVVRAIGYDSVTATLRVGVHDSVDTDFLMTASTNRLATVRVEATAPSEYGWRLREFEERRASGFGRFLDWSFFEHNRDRPLGGLLIARLPGIRTIKKFGEEYLVVSRYGRQCKPQVFVNGFLTGDFDLNSVPTDNIIGFEYYSVSNTPVRFRASGDALGGSQCGTALVWMK